MRALRMLLRKEFLQIGRDHLMLRQMFIMPVVQLLILSSAATFEVKNARLYFVDRDHTTMSRGVAQRLVASRRFTLTDASPSMERANDALLARRVDMIVGIPEGFEREVMRTRAGSVQLVLNAENGAAAGVTHGYAAEILRAYAVELGAELRPAVQPVSAIDVRTRGWYNPELDYRDYMIPGILVQLVTMIGTLLCAMNIVREKEIGTLEQLSVTPMRRGVFIAAKLIPLWIIALLELTMGLLVGRFLFGVPMVGSVVLVFFSAGVYLVAALGLGLYVSTLAHTQQQAMFVTFFIIMIYLLMSGLFTPVRSMPEWAQWMAELNPVKHFIGIMRAVMLKGAGITQIAVPLAILAAFGAAMLALAVRQYGKQAV